MNEDKFTPTKYTATVKMSGETLTLCTSARSGDGRFRFIWELAPGKRGPSEHYHPDVGEESEIVRGSITVWLDDVKRVLTAGDRIRIERGVRHRFYNHTSEPVVIRVVYDGETMMEDVFVPFAVRPYPKQPGMRELGRMIVYLLENNPTVPSSKWELRIMRTIGRTLRFFGVKAHEPVHGWDQPGF